MLVSLIIQHEVGATHSPQFEDATPDRLQAMSTERSSAVHMLLRPAWEEIEALLDDEELADTWRAGGIHDLLEILTTDLKCRAQQVTDEEITRNIESADKIIKKFGNIIDIVNGIGSGGVTSLRGITLHSVDIILASGQSSRTRIRRVLLRHSLELLRRHSGQNWTLVRTIAVDVERRLKALNAKNKGR